MAKRKKSVRKKGSRLTPKKQVTAEKKQAVGITTHPEISPQSAVGQKKVQVPQKSALETYTGENTEQIEQIEQRVKKELHWVVIGAVVSLGIGFLAGNFIKL